MKILWCGPDFSDLALRTKKAPNVAASRWSRGLLGALTKQGCAITVLSHCPEQVWPYGRFWQSADSALFDATYPFVGVSYLNVPWLRERWQRAAYRRKLEALLEKETFDAALCYNAFDPYPKGVIEVARKRGVPVVAMILDGDDPRKDNWGWLLRNTQEAAGLVFLSYWASQHCPTQKPILHMDGGAEMWRGEPPPTGKRDLIREIVYTGALDQWRGLDFMREVVRGLKRRDVRFSFCGKYSVEEMNRAFDHDPRVHLRGFLSDQEMDEMMRGADLFLNVRDPSQGDNILNYPSKVPHYLAYGRPVVSTWIDSFSPAYREVLSVAEENTPESFVGKMERILEWDEAMRLAHYEKIHTWFLRHKMWDVQAAQLIEWMKNSQIS